MTYDPDKTHLIENNTEAIRLIVDQGLLNLLRPRDGGNFASYSYQTEHHWCLASNHCGHEDDKDNGYAVCLIPKSKFTKEEAAYGFADAIYATTEGITYGYEPVPPLKHN